jgi:hypothetical protein
MYIARGNASTALSCSHGTCNKIYRLKTISLNVVEIILVAYLSFGNTCSLLTLHIQLFFPFFFFSFLIFMYRPLDLQNNPSIISKGCYFMMFYLICFNDACGFFDCHRITFYSSGVRISFWWAIFYGGSDVHDGETLSL